MDDSDQGLIDRYLTGGDDAAFGIIVSRYLNFVHAIALRITGHEELARDVVQTSFIRLAQRAALIPPGVTLAAWLHRVTHGLAVDLVRTESRRKKRELQTMIHSSTTNADDAEPDWSAISKVIDDLVNQLSAADRELVLLRYYRNQSHSAIATRLGLTETAARQRASRALEKLRTLLHRRGIATSAAALAILLPAHASPVAPQGLAISVLGAVKSITPITPNLFTSILFTVTTSQKLTFACSLMLLAVATSYSLAPDPSRAMPNEELVRDGAPSSNSRDIGSDPHRGRRVRAVPSTRDERLARLRAIMDIPDRHERDAAMISYLDGLPPNLYEETARALHDMAASPDDGPLFLTASAWARTDAAAALGFAFADLGLQPGDRFVDQILSDWGTLDPQQAISWAVKNSGASKESVDAILSGVARAFPEQVGSLVRALPRGEAKLHAFEELVRLMEQDPATREKILSGASESQKAVLYGHMVAGSAWNNGWTPEKIQILEKHPEALPFCNPSRIYSSWFYVDRSAATASIAALPPGELRTQAVAGVIAQASSTAPAEAVTLMKKYPDDMTDDLREEVLESIAKTDRALALLHSSEITDETRRHSLIRTQLARWSEDDPTAAQAWLIANPQPSSVTNGLNTER